MKNRLLPLFVVLASWTAHSQVGIGTTTPNASAQLEVTLKKDDPKRGVLIPRIALKSTTDITTVAHADGQPTTYENSLLVFNTATDGDITPGYYYWYVDRWNRLATGGDGGSGKGNDGIAGGNGAPGKFFSKRKFHLY